jgi:hypothetical protein
METVFVGFCYIEPTYLFPPLNSSQNADIGPNTLHFPAPKTRPREAQTLCSSNQTKHAPSYKTMSDIQELALAAAAFLLASSVFRWNSQNPKKAAAERNADTLMAIMTDFVFKECHAFVMASAQGLNDDYYESAEASQSQQLSELDHSYPEPTVQRSAPVPRSTEDDHFSYAGSSYSEPAAQYSELGHMFELDRKRGTVRTSPQSTSRDHFSYAAAVVDSGDDANEFGHCEYAGDRRSETPRSSPSPQSTARDHFSFAGTSTEEVDGPSEYCTAMLPPRSSNGPLPHKRKAPPIPHLHVNRMRPLFVLWLVHVEGVDEPNELGHFGYHLSCGGFVFVYCTG